MSTDERTSTESASGTSIRAGDRGKRSRRIARIRQGLPRRLSMSKSERPVPVMNNAQEMSQHSETLSESAASVSSSKSQPYEINQSEADSLSPADRSPEDPMIPRRIVQWITRVANSSEQLSPDTPNSTKPKPGVTPEPLSEPSQPHRGVRRRGHHRITRPVPAYTSGNRLGQLSERLTLMRDRSRLWQLASDSTLKLYGTDPGVWLLGTYFGDPEPESAPAIDPSEASTDSVQGTTSETNSEAMDNTRSHSAWRARLNDHLRTLVWCTYRSHFPPLAQDGYIGADEEATSAAVSAATEELCIPTQTSTNSPSNDADDQDSSTDPPQSLMQFLTRSREVLQNTGTTRDWLINQLESRGWQLPGLLAQLPITSALLSRNESSPAMIASRIQQILGAVEHDVLKALRRPLAANVPMARLRSLAANWGGETGLPGLWSYVRAIYQSVSSIALPNGPSCDAGWGCMLRTAQSLLATSLIRVHLGRDWTLPKTVDGQILWRSDEEHAKYARILSLFYDDPSSACPFSVHRLAAEGKRLGIEVGSWFGPSTVAKALDRLARPTRLGITLVVTNDGVLYQDEVLDAAHNWDCPVLVLVAQRIGLEEVPKTYRSALKNTFSMPQSVGVAGGRPSSSVYFVGTQREQLLYLDPHTTRPSVPFRHVPPSLTGIEVLEKNTNIDTEKHHLLTSWYCHAYSTHELTSYRPVQTHLMPLSVVDPSILMGFVLHSENDWLEFREAAARLPAPLIHIAEHRPDYAKHSQEKYGSAQNSIIEPTCDPQRIHRTGEPSETNTQKPPGGSNTTSDLDAKLAQTFNQDLDLDPEWML